MPTYDYQCESCGHKMEAFQSITAKPMKKCPECGKNTLRRLIGTGAGIIFKGSGFWQTDYRSDNYKKAQKADTESKPDKTESSSDKSSNPSETAGDKNKSDSNQTNSNKSGSGTSDTK